MKPVEYAARWGVSVLLLATAAACADHTVSSPVMPGGPSPDLEALAPPTVTITGTCHVFSSNPGTYTWQADPSGGDGTYTYQWKYRLADATSWTNAGTASSYSRSVGSADSAFDLKVIVTSASATGEDKLRVTVGLDAYPRVYITGPADVTTAGNHTWEANASCGDGSYTYQWKYRPQGGSTWTNVGTASSYTRNVAAGDPDFDLKVVVTSDGLSDQHAVEVNVDVPPPPTVAISGPSVVDTAGSKTWTATAVGGNGTYSYQWQYRPTGTSTWTNVGTNSSSYTRSVSAGDPDFELQVTVTSAGQTASDTHAVDVDILHVVITGPLIISTAGSHTWVANRHGGTGTPVFQWQYRPQGTTTWTDVGSNSSLYARTVVAGNPDFELKVTVTAGGVSASDTHLVYVGL